MERQPEKRTPEQRLIALETELAHQQRLCEQLNEVLIEHTKAITQMERIILRLEGQVKEIRRQAEDAKDPADDKPPHY